MFTLAACGPTAPVSTDTAGGEGSTNNPVGASTSTTTAVTTADPTTGATTTAGQSSGPFVADPDMGGLVFIPPSESCLAIGPHGQTRCTPIECDPWDQNCPEGHKCSPYSGDGDNAWESLKCVPLDRDPDHPGDPCTAEGSGVSGIDSCDIDSMCWDFDVETMTGTCVLRCTGSPDDPICPPGARCMIANDGVLNLCLPACDPLAPDCPGDDVCVPDPSGTAFICVSDDSGDEGQLFDPCAFINACDQGLACAAPDLATECDPNAFGCCLLYCDFAMPPACPGAMQQCLPWFEEGQAPSGLENVGLCTIPP